jgi:hypothetical protein
MSSKATGRHFGAGLLTLVFLGAVGTWCLSQAAPHADSTQSPGVKNLRSPTKKTNLLPIIRHLSQSQRANFSVFETSVERLPRSLRQAIRGPIYGINWRLAQRLPVPVRMWAVPGNGYICLLSLQRHQGIGATCNTTAGVLRRGLATTFLSEQGVGIFRTNRRLIVGIAPERTSAIVAQGPESSVRIPVIDGIFMRRDTFANPPERLRLVERSP